MQSHALRLDWGFVRSGTLSSNDNSHNKIFPCFKSNISFCDVRQCCLTMLVGVRDFEETSRKFSSCPGSILSHLIKLTKIFCIFLTYHWFSKTKDITPTFGPAVSHFFASLSSSGLLRRALFRRPHTVRRQLTNQSCLASYNYSEGADPTAQGTQCLFQSVVMRVSARYEIFSIISRG